MVAMVEQEIPLYLIDPPEQPSRDAIDPASLADLADDIASNGLLQRVGLVGPSPEGRYRVSWGDRRTRALRLLEWAAAPAKVAPWGTDPRIMRAAENLVRVQLNPREEGRAVKELLDAGMPLAHVARVMRRSQEWCEQRAAILDWPEELQAGVSAGTLPLAVARQLAGIDHDAYRAELVREAERTGANSRTVAVWLSHYAADRERIITNHVTVAEITARREEWVVMFTCDCCAQQADARSSALLRVCPGCLKALRDEQAAAAAPGS
jgi:ParB/RepB/Spo0J family partition protein